MTSDEEGLLLDEMPERSPAKRPLRKPGAEKMPGRVCSRTKRLIDPIKAIKATSSSQERIKPVKIVLVTARSTRHSLAKWLGSQL